MADFKISYARARLAKSEVGTDAWFDWRTTLDGLLYAADVRTWCSEVFGGG